MAWAVDDALAQRLIEHEAQQRRESSTGGGVARGGIAPGLRYETDEDALAADPNEPIN